MTGLHVEPMTPFAAHVAQHGERALVRLIGELDLAAAPQAEAALAQAERWRPPLLEVDLSTLAFMDSTGLRLMLRTRHRAQDDGRRLLLHRGPVAVQRVFEITSLASLFEFVD
ncbi:MAG TPA: STAS domain-containing protein [Conexibacter sp.]|nr:STAS domain-containing protein [Conexibacter sp.]